MNSSNEPLLKYVRIRKMAAAENAQFSPGQSESYLVGQASVSHSFPIDYWLEGWLLSPPALGERVRVLRVARNGVRQDGCFSTTEVKEIRNGRVFCTANSVYEWDEIQPPSI